MEHAIYMYMKHYTAGRAEDVIEHGVHNGVDAWRKLYRDQLPLAEDKRNLLMTEFMSLKEPATASGLRHLTLEIERITDLWERLWEAVKKNDVNLRDIERLVELTSCVMSQLPKVGEELVQVS